MKWRDGSKFEGEWRNDERLKGKMTFSDSQSSYTGSFNEDLYNGIGEISDGKNKFKGIFENGKIP